MKIEQVKKNEAYMLKLPPEKKVMLFDVDITHYFHDREVVCTGFVAKLPLTPILIRCDKSSTIDVAVSSDWLYPLKCICETQTLMLSGCLCGGK